MHSPLRTSVATLSSGLLITATFAAGTANAGSPFGAGSPPGIEFSGTAGGVHTGLPADDSEAGGVRTLTDGLPIDTGDFGADETAPDGTTAAPEGVADEVYEAVDADGTASVIIRLTEQADRAELARTAANAGAAAAARLRSADPAAVADAAKAARAKTVVDELQALADNTQAGVLDVLSGGDASDVREFWIFNGVAATVDEATLAELEAHPDVASVTLDDVITLDEPFETGEPNLPSWSVEAVNAPDVWGEYGVRGEGVVVGVMDGGVDGTHPALKDSWRGADGDVDSSWFVATGEDYPEPGDGGGHGTHVTGSIVGGPPGEITGVAPDAQWIAAKIFRDNGSTTDSFIHAAFEWMLAPGGDPAKAPDVVNNSWGSDNGADTEFEDDVDAWLAAGIVPMFANGNAGPAPGTVGSPASFPQSIGVGATDINDFISDFSSRGPAIWDGEEYLKPQISGPGENVRSTVPAHLSEDGYLSASGTSMATPHVTGVVALMLSANPGMTVDEVRDVLVDTARAEPHMGALPNSAYGSGIADAYAAVTAVAHSGTLTGTVTGPDGPLEATITVAGETATSDPASGGYELTVPDGTHEVTVSAYGYATATSDVTITTDQTTTHDVTLAVAPEHTLSGTVTSGGDPVADARLTVPGTPIDPVFTGADGTFALTIPAGDYTLRVNAAGYEPSSTDVSIDGDTDLSVVLEPLTTPTAAGWRQLQNNPTRSGLAADSLAAHTLQDVWSRDVGSDVVFASPVMDDTRVYVGSDDGALTALDIETGEPMWTFQTGPALRGAPAVTDGLVISGGGTDGGIFALDAETGDLVWDVATPDRFTVYTEPAIADGVVYVATGPSQDAEDTVFALDAATGQQIWATDVGTSVFGGLAVADGRVIVGNADDAELIALDAATGAEQWTLTRENDYFIGDPSLVDGTVYVATTNSDLGGSLLAVDAATGTLQWENETHGDGQGSTPAVFGDLVIATSHANGFVAAYDRATGEPVWHYGINGAVSAPALVSSDGYAIVGTQLDNRIVGLDASTGELVWDTPVTANATSGAAYSGGTLVTADTSGTVHAFTPTGTLRGTITGPDGPVAASAEIAETGTSIEVAADGTFELSHRPGEFTLVVSEYGLVRQEIPVEIRAGRTTVHDVELQPGGSGAVDGVVRDDEGTALEGATVTLGGTPLDPTTTGADGAFGFGDVAEGRYELTVTLAGYASVTESVQVVAGATTTVQITLTPYDVAVVGDYENRITDVLSDLGYLAEPVSYADVTANPDAYGVVVANGARESDPGEGPFLDFIAATDAAGTSVVWLDQWSLGWGAINHLHDYLGDPATLVDEFSHSGEVSMIPTVEHPLTAGLPVGEPAPILVPNDWSAFEGYSGTTVAELATEELGVVGDGLAFKPRSFTSTHVLVGSLAAAATWGVPDQHWLPAATTVLDNAVRYASEAEYGEVGGTVTDEAGTPVEASIEILGTGETLSAGADGGYEVLLAPGDYTLRFSQLGLVTAEHDVTVVAGETATLDVTLADAGTGTVTGTVTSSGTPVAGASVEVAGLSATTAGDGTYVIADVPGGEHELIVSATGYFSASETVSVTDGEETVATVDLMAAPHVGVIEDYSGDGVIPLLEANEFTTEEIDFADVGRVADFDVIVFNDPDDPGETAFLGFLDAMEAAQVSGIFPDDRFSSRGGTRLLREYFGDPEGFTAISFEGAVSYDALDPSHPLFAGLPDPAQILLADRYATTIDGYSGVPLADIVTEEGTTGVGAAYTARPGGSVHLLLSGFAATIFQGPEEDWTDDGERLYLNAITWAADPGLGEVAGTVTSESGAPLPATITVDGSAAEFFANADGSYVVPVEAGAHTIRFAYFGYQPTEVDVTVAEGETVNQDVALAPATDTAVTGAVTSDGTPVAGAEVALRGTPLTTTTAADGTYTFEPVTDGEYEVDVSADGYVRARVPVSVAGGDVVADVELRPSPTVGIIEDYQDRLAGYLTFWGYDPVPLDWNDDPLDLTGLDLIVANLGTSDDPGEAGFAAFQDAVNRAGLPVLWLDQFGRGSFQYLEQYEGDPAVIGDGRSDGAVTATVTDTDHPLVAGLPATFELVEEDEEYSWYDEFSGTSVATVTSAEEPGGQLAGFRGRGASAVDVLVGTLSVSFYGYPAYDGSPGRNWSPDAERLLRNAIGYALDAPALAGEVRGTVTDGAGAPVAGEVVVAESGKTHPVAADGSFVVPLQPGDWTLEVTSFGYEQASVPVTIEAGDVVTEDVVLTALPTGSVGGTVTGPDGPIDGADVSVTGTELGATTAADGTYTITDIPVGEWTLRVTASGHQSAESDVTVTADATVTADFALGASQPVAIVSDYLGSITDLLEADGYTVTSFSNFTLDDLAATVGDYELVIFNRSVSSFYHDDFVAVIDGAAAAGTSTIYGGQWGGYAIGSLSDVRGDPADVEYGFVPNGIDYVPHTAHPIFEGYALGEPIPLITDEGTNQQWLSFSGYSGNTLADVAARDDGSDLGTAVGWQFTSLSSVEVLLGSLSAAGYGRPGDEWTADAERIYLNAVGWAVSAEAAQVSGTVTGDGAPIEGATVTAEEADVSVTTSADGTYLLGLAEGSYTITASAHGFEPASESITVAAGESVSVDFDLVPLPRGDLAGVVTSTDGSPVEGATVSGSGPDEWSVTTDADGGYVAEDVLAGGYEVTVTADGFLPAEETVTVPPDGAATLDVTLRPLNVGVLGDVGGGMTKLLRSHDVAAGGLSWDAELDVTPYDVLVVNGGSPDDATFTSVLDAADANETSVIFTGTWGVDQGGVRLLEKYTSRVSVGEQGYGEGPVTLTGFSGAEALFAGLSDPAELVVEGGYYSVLSSYIGAPLATLSVAQESGGPVTGIGAGYDWRTTGSVEIVLSASALTEEQGPGLGWTEDGIRLLVNAVTWAEDATLSAPDVPTITVPEPGVTFDETMTVTGTTSWPATVEVRVDGEAVASAGAGFDGSWSATIPLEVGDNDVTAVASNDAGSSEESDPVLASRWVPEWNISGRGLRTVLLTLDGAPMFPDPTDSVTLVVRDSAGQEIVRQPMAWVVAGYLTQVWVPPGGRYTFSAEVVVDGVTLITTAPE